MTDDGPNSNVREAGAIMLNASEIFTVALLMGIGFLGLIRPRISKWRIYHRIRKSRYQMILKDELEGKKFKKRYDV